MPARVDVIIPVYNRPVLANDAITSVLNQTFQEISIYIIDDGSHENVQASGIREKERLHYYNLEHNHGVSYCRNFAVSKGKAEFIAFLDSDDLWHPQKIEKQLDFFEKHHELNWVHTNENWLRGGQPVKQHKRFKKQGGIFLDRLFERCLISPSAVMFRRSFYEKNGGFLEHFKVAEDYELWLRLNLENPIGYLEDPLTIKQAGEWTQLSSTIKIDHYRVLALHRFYRMFKNNAAFNSLLKQKWHHEISAKTAILLNGAIKYNNQYDINRYQLWGKLFKTLRT